LELLVESFAAVQYHALIALMEIRLMEGLRPCKWTKSLGYFNMQVQLCQDTCELAVNSLLRFGDYSAEIGVTKEMLEKLKDTVKEMGKEKDEITSSHLERSIDEEN
jgi:hypothetical protein